MTMPRALPGLAIALLLAFAASLLPWLLVQLSPPLARLPLSPILLAILLGLALSPLAARQAGWRPGLGLAAGPLLKLAVVLVGLRLSLGELAATGLDALPLVLAVILTGLIVAFALGRAFGIPGRLTALLGVGSAICGASAIAATAPALRAKPEETAYAVSCVALFGLGATLLYPPLLNVLFDDGRSIGMILGAAIHDTGQVTGAALLYEQSFADSGALDVATVTKLLRNLGMLAVIPLVVALYATDGARGRHRPAFPLFILGFIAMAMLRSAGDHWLSAGAETAWQSLLTIVGQASAFLFATAMAALGMSIRLEALKPLGWRPAFAALLTALAIGTVAVGATLFVPA
jgi:uncharacterized integral membrane protein (TIGR00698 family)